MSVIREIAVFLLGLLLTEALPTTTKVPAPPPKQLIQPSFNDPYDVNFFDQVTDQRQSAVAGNVKVNVDGIMIGAVVPGDVIDDSQSTAYEELAAIADMFDIQGFVEKQIENFMFKSSSTTERTEELSHTSEDATENTTTEEAESSSTQEPEESTLMVQNLHEKEQEKPKPDNNSGNKN